MIVTMIAVTSANGKLTRGKDPDIYKWTSKEDYDFFSAKIDEAKLIVMGSGTYDVISSKLKHEEGKLRIVITSVPERYQSKQVPGSLEFTSDSPRDVYDKSMIDHTDMLLVGGAKIFSSFAKVGLIDEIYLTIEPKMFGLGKPLFVDEEFDLDLKLVSSNKLNEKGTLILKYQVIK